MTFQQLETFYWIARLGSFVAAARRLNTTQSAISMRIHQLETALGVALFDRSRRQAQLTGKGRELVKYAEQVVQLASEIRHRLGDRQTYVAHIRLGVAELVALAWLPALVSLINRTYPGVTLELHISLTLELNQLLASGDLDLALLPGPIVNPAFTGLSLGTVEFGWMASPKLKVPKGPLTPCDLDDLPLLMLSSQSNLHAVLGDWFRANGARGHRIDMCNTLGVIASMTIARLGVSYLPVQHYEPEIRARRLRLLRTTPPIPDLEYFAVHQKRQREPLVPLLADMARQASTFRPHSDAPDSRSAAQ